MTGKPAAAPDWRDLIRQQAGHARVEIPHATVEELALHLEDIVAAARAAGATDAEAHARGMRALDESALGVLRRHSSRDPRRQHARAAEATAHASRQRSFNVAHAIRVALRQFSQHRTFSLVTVLVLGLGTGAATTVFTIVDAVVLRPLPYEAPQRLVTMWDANYEKGLSKDPVSPVNFMDYRDLPVFKDAAAWWRPGVNLTDPNMDPVRVNTIEVSANLFEVLGVKPQVGPGFPEKGPFYLPNESIAVISDRLWRTRYSGDPSIIGRPISLNGNAHTVVGIMPAKFHYPDDIDVWQRLHWDLRQHSRAAHFMEAVARLNDGQTFDEAQSAMQALALRMQRDFPNTNRAWATRLVPLLDSQLGYYRPALMVLFGAVGLLLVIGCLNVASLLLTRALSREREIAVRVAMGAAPRQLVTQLLAESFVLSVAGAAVGIAAAAAALPLILHFTPVQIPRLDEAGLDLRALGLCLAVVVTTTVFFGLVPALLLLRGQIVTGLRAGERGSSRNARTIYSVLVAGEVALACALLVSSALLVRTVAKMTHTPTGVNADQVLTTTVQLAQSSYRDWRLVAETHNAIIDHIRQQPGVIAAGGGNFLPLEVGWRVPFRIEGDPAAGTTRRRAAGAVPQRQRWLLRGARRPTRTGTIVSDDRRSRFGRCRDRQRNTRAALSDRGNSGRTHLPDDSRRNRPAGCESHAAARGSTVRSATTAAAPANPLRNHRRGKRRAERPARSGRGTGRLFHDAAVSFPGADAHGAGERAERGHDGRAHGPEKRRAKRADGQGADLGRAIRGADRPVASAHDDSRLLRLSRRPPRGDRCLRSPILVRRAAHARIGDPAHAGSTAAHGRHIRDSSQRCPRGRRARQSAWCSCTLRRTC